MTRPDEQDYLWDRSGTPDPEVARLEQLLAPLAHDAPLDELRLRRRRRGWLPWIVSGVAVAAAAVVAVVLLWPRSPGIGECKEGFAFSLRGGKAGVLCVGNVLDTGAHEADLAIANIGNAELGSGTRVRLDQTTAERHQLYLERGRMHARVNAPPRLFAVATPSAHVTDLGCEYTLDIDARGAGTIEVQSGKVELATGTGAIVVAPRGTKAHLLPGRRPGLPVVNSASPAMMAAVAAFESGAPDGIERVIGAAAQADALTVANLALLVAPPAEKRRVLEGLATLVPPPQDLTIDDVLGESTFFEMWFDEVILLHLTNNP